ncbi:MAG: hypothetical protein ACKVXR_18185, partial [Planctomycetota bacterium]
RRARARFARLGCDRLEIWLAELLRARERIEMLRQVSARWILEATLLDLCRAETSIGLEELQARLLALEARLAGGTSRPATIPAPAKPRAAEQAAPAAAAPPARSEEWPALLGMLEAEARTLGEILRAKGKLESRGPGAATIRLAALREDERAIVAEPRNARLVSSALSRIVGAPCQASLVIGEAGGPPKRSSADLFTRQVAESFGGKIEEES